MNRFVLLVALATATAATLAAPTAAAGPCDNPIEELLCTVVDIANDNVQAIRDGVQHFCDHWLQGCKVGNVLP